jgi:hypothetical protein
MNINISNYIDFKELLFDLYLSDSENILNDESLTDLVFLYSLGKGSVLRLKGIFQNPVLLEKRSNAITWFAYLHLGYL